MNSDLFSKEQQEDLEKSIQYYENLSFEGLRNFDRSILTLSSGALAVSITFLDNITDQGAANLLFAMIGAILLFTTAIILNVLSYGSQYLDMDFEVNKLLNYRDTGEEVLTSVNKFATVSKFLTFGAGFAFLSAIFFLVIFVISNMGGQHV